MYGLCMNAFVCLLKCIMEFLVRKYEFRPFCWRDIRYASLSVLKQSSSYEIYGMDFPVPFKSRNTTTKTFRHECTYCFSASMISDTVLLPWKWGLNGRSSQPSLPLHILQSQEYYHLNFLLCILLLLYAQAAKGHEKNEERKMTAVPCPVKKYDRGVVKSVISGVRRCCLYTCLCAAK